MPRPCRVLILVQNLPVPFDRRVWQEATTLHANGYDVSVICPKGRGYNAAYEAIDGIHIYRHPLPIEAQGALGYALEYGWSLLWEMWLSLRIACTRGCDIIHACNPPDSLFIIGWVFKRFGKKFIFDHHDLNPELYEAKFNRRDGFYRLLCWLERCSFRTADRVIATNDSYRHIAITRGGVDPAHVAVVRSGPDLARMVRQPPVPACRMGKRFLVGYIGVMGQQEGVHHLLEAARILTQEWGRADVHFTLIGDGPERANLQRMCAQMGLQAHVTFTGRIADAPMLEILNTADICVNSDTVNPMNSLSTMNKIMEYMALAKPIVQFEVIEGKYPLATRRSMQRPIMRVTSRPKFCYCLTHQPYAHRWAHGGVSVWKQGLPGTTRRRSCSAFTDR